MYCIRNCKIYKVEKEYKIENYGKYKVLVIPDFCNPPYLLRIGTDAFYNLEDAQKELYEREKYNLKVHLNSFIICKNRFENFMKNINNVEKWS